jgi:hypothetical protein
MNAGAMALLSVCLLCSIRILSPGGGGFGCCLIDDVRGENAVEAELKTSEAFAKRQVFHREGEEVRMSSGSVASWQRKADSA